MWHFFFRLAFILLVLPITAIADDTAQTPMIEQGRLLSYLADKSAFTLIDARSPEEFRASHVDGAINIPHSALDAHRQQLPEDLDGAILIYCKTGVRAGKLAEALRRLGYHNVEVLPSKQLMFYSDMVVFNCGAKS
ncbi:rhodanese-like domain-containing protein [Microbulbifer hainanensis]|uniref:rhodanese-like domain-containing protein n=1 Tax=Microbulbifer hainanensis TaxID=2735675 RepID=UPI0018685EE1|nr:rhodanese-like domain-containing protein [Microbulbifer hainanensis]